MKSQQYFQFRRSLLVMLIFCSVAAIGLISVVRSSHPANAASCPTTCGSYTVSGLGARKQQILNTGGNTLDLAVAMEETETMQATYPYGDGKTGDAANFGIFKQNWYMLRTSVPQYESYGPDASDSGAALNNNLSWDIQCIHYGQSHYGTSTWFAGQRDGQSGISNPNTTDINNYRNAIYWIQSQIDSGHQTDDVRFWVTIPAI